jgi:hypothetical protein
MVKLFFFSVILFVAMIYFIPAFVAIARRHAHVLQITILNAFLGWCFPIWVASLIWSTTKNTDEFVETKGAWITIAAFLILMSAPLFVYTILPPQYKAQTKEEFKYKKVIYTTDIETDSGKVVRKVIEIKHDED